MQSHDVSEGGAQPHADPRFLLVLLGHVPAKQQSRHGDYDRLIAPKLRAASPDAAECPLDVWPLIDNPAASPPDLRRYVGVIFSGGPSNVYEGGEWLDAAAAYARLALKLEKPLLGICLGHQVLAHTAGGAVKPLSATKNQGTRQVDLLEPGRTDALVGFLPETFDANVSHFDGVVKPSSEITILGRTPYDGCHMLRVGRCAWGVQFHPEFDYAYMRDGLLSRAQVADETTSAALRREMQSLSPSPPAAGVLPSFARFCLSENKAVAT